MRPRLLFAPKLVEEDLSLLKKWVTSGGSNLKIQLEMASSVIYYMQKT